VALLSFAVRPALPLSFRPIELIGMGGAAAFVSLVVRDGRSRRWEGALLIAVYIAFVIIVYHVGDR
jgi:Ca2+/H+ antiporter